MPERLTVADAAEVLGISEGAVRQRLNRGTLRSEKDVDGRVYVLYGDDTTEDIQTVQSVSTAVEALQEQVQYLREQLDNERRARIESDRENRRLLAAALERIPAIEAPQEASSEPRESPETASEPQSDTQEASPQGEKRSWWQRWFGG